MSWRFLFLFLVLAAASAVFGGIELGDWLIEHAPESIAQASANAKSDRDVVLDANGKPFRAQPPQPRIDGTLGVPREMAPVEWTIAAVTATQIAPEENATQVGTDEAQELPTAGVGLSSAASDIATVDVFFPMDPQWILLSPSLAKATLVPILSYASSWHWKFPNARS